jgi:hypothetical protein
MPRVGRLGNANDRITCGLTHTLMTWVIDRWLQLEELAGLFGLSEETINRVAKSPGVLTSEMLRWLKASAARTADLCR